MPGYSGTPLVKKLGIKSGSRVKTKNAPESYVRWLEPLPAGVTISPRLRAPIDIWHVFTKKRSTLLPTLNRAIVDIAPSARLTTRGPG